MSAPEHQIRQFDAFDAISEAVYFDRPTNLNGAGVQFVYRKRDDTTVNVREATFSSPTPSTGAATSCTAQNVWDLSAGDLQVADVFVYEWKFILSDGTILVRPLNAPTDDFPDRKNPSFEVVAALSSGDESEGEDIPMANRPIQVANLTELAGLAFSTNYKIVFVVSDANGNPGAYIWDATITPSSALAEDPTGSSVVALTSGTGGFRRQGI